MDAPPDLRPDPDYIVDANRRRSSCSVRASLAVAIAIGLSCGMCWALLPDLCGEEDVLRSPAPGGHAEARTFLWNCGATTRYVNVAMLRVDGWVWHHEDELYRSDRGGMPQLSWAAVDRLIVDCSQCAEPRQDHVFHGVSVSYIGPHNP